MKIADMHCDTISKMYNARKEGIRIGLKHNNCQIDLLKMKKSSYVLQFFACFINIKKCDNPLVEAINMIELFHSEVKANNDLIRIVKNGNDTTYDNAAGRISALLTIEEGAVLQGSVEVLHEMYRRDVRGITLTWNYENELGYPNNAGEPQTTRGLKEKGIEIVQEMERLHMIIDVSHLSDAGVYDVLNNTKGPIAATHSNARTLTSHVRNLTDDMIEKIANRGGVIGVNFCPLFLRDGFTSWESGISTVKDIVLHIKYLVKHAGIEGVGIGTDFDGIEGKLEIRDCSMMNLLYDELIRNSFTYNDIDRILYKNIVQFTKNVI